MNNNEYRKDEHFYFSATVLPADSVQNGKAKYFSREQVKSLDLRGIPLYFEHVWTGDNNQRLRPFGVVMGSKTMPSGEVLALVEMAPVPGEVRGDTEQTVRRRVIEMITTRELRDVSLRHVAAKMETKGPLHLDLKMPLELSVTTEGALPGSSIREWFWRKKSINPGGQRAILSGFGKTVAGTISVADATMWEHSMMRQRQQMQQSKKNIQLLATGLVEKNNTTTEHQEKTPQMSTAASAAGSASYSDKSKQQLQSEEEKTAAELLLSDIAMQGNVRSQELQKQLAAVQAQLEKAINEANINAAKAKEWDEVNSQRMDQLKKKVKTTIDFNLDQAATILKETAEVDDASKKKLEEIEKLRADPPADLNIKNNGSEWVMDNDALTRFLGSNTVLEFAHSRKRSIEAVRAAAIAHQSALVAPAAASGQKRAIDTSSVAPGAAAASSSSSSSSTTTGQATSVPAPSMKKYKKLDDILGPGASVLDFDRTI